MLCFYCLRIGSTVSYSAVVPSTVLPLSIPDSGHKFLSTLWWLLVDMLLPKHPPPCLVSYSS